MERTPNEISNTILSFCNGINGDEKPQYITVSSFNYCLENHCFPNVDETVREKGGHIVNGWVIWQWDNIILEAEAHAVWENPKGEVIDVTPHTPEESQIVFLRDSNVKYNGIQYDNIRKGLTDSKLVAEYIALCQELYKIQDENRKDSNSIEIKDPQTIKRYRTIEEKKIVLEKTFCSNVGRNDPCPCGSGRKYKKCCLPFRG
ncbi:SEC-C domain-containing protein [Candidatus Micrarchaeota archaeon]|jgi:uncharacterized protein YchJ|nr:SEC-C domain-containing protein [Candidatus Micrarchaeota archaeon]